MNNTLQNEFDKMLADQVELKRQFQERAQNLFKNITKDFFEKNTGITAVIWNQYTPYFNDGEACTFSVNGASFTNAPLDEIDSVRWGEYEGETEGVWACDNVYNVLTSDRDYYKEDADKIRAAGGVDADTCKLFNSAISSREMEDVMLTMFGDHVKVIATRNGFDVEDYSHD